MKAEEEKKARARYAHRGITLLRERVAKSYDTMKCDFCNRRHKDKESMKGDLWLHILIQTSTLQIQALRQGALDARQAESRF